MHCCWCICVDSSSGWFTFSSSLWEISRDFFLFYFIFRSILLSMCIPLWSHWLFYFIWFSFFFPVSLFHFTHFGVSFSFGGIVSSPLSIRFLENNRKSIVSEKKKPTEKKWERRNRNSAGFIKRMYTECVWSENVLIRPVASWYTKTIYSHVIDACERSELCDLSLSN